MLRESGLQHAKQIAENTDEEAHERIPGEPSELKLGSGPYAKYAAYENP